MKHLEFGDYLSEENESGISLGPSRPIQAMLLWRDRIFLESPETRHTPAIFSRLRVRRCCCEPGEGYVSSSTNEPKNSEEESSKTWRGEGETVRSWGKEL